MRILSFVAVTVILTGCVSKQDYPSEWSELQLSNSNCPSISGIYSNMGLVTEAPYAPLLHRVLNVQQAAESIAIHSTGKKITITPYNAGVKASIIELEFPTENIYCENGYLVIDNAYGYNRGGALAQEWKTYYLAQTADGLIVKQKHSALGMLFFIPVASSETHWFLFRNTLN